MTRFPTRGSIPRSFTESGTKTDCFCECRSEACSHTPASCGRFAHPIRDYEIGLGRICSQCFDALTAPVPDRPIAPTFLLVSIAAYWSKREVRHAEAP